jgi:5'-3' exoribonuclease 1
MNSIIHNCTHKDSDSPTFRLTEDKMFIAIFNYIEHLFSQIKPKKLFFMAIDGVAPRAKMNQQRARRFRTARDAEVAREKAIKEGVDMPKEDPFDSNCITPGTEFMAKLSKHLKYFINKKVSEDVDWQGVEIVLSGHEVPGEGEHKIMEYIRQAKAQKFYDPNMRHCLYGLDADLIMLGLLSHDPHFCLLREEVTFGRQSQTKSKELEHQRFYLLHLCLIREYLEMEFQELKEPGVLSVPFDMERIIDDFILMAFFVGNDFLPNLPHLHINEGALALMFGVYKGVLAKAGGYINEGGVINIKRLKLLLDDLSHVEFRFFEHENADAKWFKGKRMEKEDVMQRTKRKGVPVTMSSEQQQIFQGVEKFLQYRSSGEGEPYNLPHSLPARDRKFVEELAHSLHLQWATVEDDEGNRHMQLSFPPSSGNSEESEESSEDEEAQAALNRVLSQFRKAKIVDISADDAQAEMERKYQEQFRTWKNNYYKEKYGWDMSNTEELRKLTENYVQGLQWVLYYYYQGVVSWPWFYRYHYSPMISDVHLGLGADLNFTLGQPFRPFQQLMGVLPDRSKKIVPEPYHELMTDPNSPIIEFYPRNFELDMNGKKMDWEAVVKIPFIEEDKLLRAMATKDHLLSPDERERNSFGVSLKFTHDPSLDYVYPSSLQGIFPDLEHCHCVENIFELPTMDGLEVYHGLMEGALLGVQALAGFPSMKTLPYTAQLLSHGVCVFQQDSRNESMILTLLDPSQEKSKIIGAQSLLGKSIFIGYPFLQEAKVVKVSDELFDYSLDVAGHPSLSEHDSKEIETWKKKATRIENRYSKNLGIVIGDVESLVHVEMLKGLLKNDDGSTVKEYAVIEGQELDYATQTIVDEVYSADPRFVEEAAKPIEEEFPVESRVFFLGEFAYGRPVRVDGHENGKLIISVLTLKEREPEFGRELAARAQLETQYFPSYAVARQHGIHPLALSKITSALSVESNGLRLNLGLNLKFEAKKQKVLGYSRKTQSGWEYSQKAVDLILLYRKKFPEFFTTICERPKGDIYKDEDFYPKEIARDKIKDIGQWLKSIQSKSFEAVPLEADQLDSDAVMAIQHAAMAYNAKSETFPKQLKSVPRNALLNPTDADKRIGGQSFQLGDRVVYVLSSGKVPIAQRGTVVGITRTSRQTWLDIVFDTSFMSGTTLGDRCDPFHGASVPANSVLNLSYRQVVASSRATEARRPPVFTQPLTVPGYGMPTGINGRGQSFPAAAPPPLGGSFRNAAAGQPRGFHNQLPYRSRGGSPQTNGYQNPQNDSGNGRGGRAGYAHTSLRGTDSPRGARGRGAPRAGIGAPASNRGGYTIIDNVDPNQGVRSNNVRPVQSYNSVPPPASLNNTLPQRGGRGTRGGPAQNGRGLPAARGRGAARARGRGS